MGDALSENAALEREHDEAMAQRADHTRRVERKIAFGKEHDPPLKVCQIKKPTPNGLAVWCECEVDNESA